MELNIIKNKNIPLINNKSETKNNIYSKEREILLKRLTVLSEKSDNLSFRFLALEDINKSYFDLLSNLTVSPVPSFPDWRNQIEKLTNSNTFVVVIEDKNKNIIVGNLTCLIEEKFTRGLSRVCHIEDVVVKDRYRNNKLGSKLINLAIEFSKEISCYKVILDGRYDAIEFYKKFGFERKFNCMGFYPK